MLEFSIQENFSTKIVNNPKRNWEVVTEQTTLDHPPYIKVVKKDFVRPDGIKVEDYYILEYPTWVNVIALTADNDIILVSQFRPGANKILTGIPSGSISEESDSSAEEGIRRELREETGYGGGEFIHIGTLYPNPAHQNNVVLTFLAIGVGKQGDAITDQEEDIHVEVTYFMDYVKMSFENPTQSVNQSIYTAALALAVNFILKSQQPQLRNLKQELRAYFLGE